MKNYLVEAFLLRKELKHFINQMAKQKGQLQLRYDLLLWAAQYFLLITGGIRGVSM